MDGTGRQASVSLARGWDVRGMGRRRQIGRCGIREGRSCRRRQDWLRVRFVSSGPHRAGFGRGRGGLLPAHRGRLRPWRRLEQDGLNGLRPQTPPGAGPPASRVAVKPSLPLGSGPRPWRDRDGRPRAGNTYPAAGGPAAEQDGAGLSGLAATLSCGDKGVRMEIARDSFLPPAQYPKNRTSSYPDPWLPRKHATICCFFLVRFIVFVDGNIMAGYLENAFEVSLELFRWRVVP